MNEGLKEEDNSGSKSHVVFTKAESSYPSSNEETIKKSLIQLLNDERKLN